MIELIVNNKPFHTNSKNVADMLAEYEARPPYAVAVNGEFVPRSAYSQHRLNEGDSIEVVAPIFGG